MGFLPRGNWKSWVWTNCRGERNGTEVPFSEFDLTGKVAIVTGAGRGMGYHIALALAKYGADLVVCSRTVSELERVGAEIEKFGRRVLIQQMDVTKIPEIHAMVEQSVKAFGHIDILVNNAGVNITQWAVDVTEEAWDRVLDTNLKALFFCAQAVGKVMIRQRKGKIINISSQTGTVGHSSESGLLLEQGRCQPTDKTLGHRVGSSTTSTSMQLLLLLLKPLLRNPCLRKRAFVNMSWEIFLWEEWGNPRMSPVQ